MQWVKNEGIAAVLGLRFGPLAFGRVDNDAFRLIVHTRNPSEALDAGNDVASLRQPHVQTQPQEGVWIHLM